MDEQTLEKIEIYKEYNRAIENFKALNFTTNRFYICVLAIIMFVILTSKQVFSAGSLIFTFIFSFFGLCLAIMWVITQDTYSNMIKIKYGEVMEVIEKELPVKPYTMEYEAVCEYRKTRKFFSFDRLQNFLALTSATIFTILFASEILPFFILVQSMMSQG